MYTGKNLRLDQEVTNLNPWICSYVNLKAALIQAEVIAVPNEDRWRLPYLGTLLGQRREAFNMALETEEKRLTALIDSLVIN